MKNFNVCFICESLGQKPKNIIIDKNGFLVQLCLGRCFDHEGIHFCNKCGSICEIVGQLVCFKCIELI